MLRIKRPLLGYVSVFITLFLFSPALPVWAQSQSQPQAASGDESAGEPAKAAPKPAPPVNVNVVNTPGVSVTNTPTVNVANNPSVTISGTPAVNVTNGPTSPVMTANVDDPGRIPYQSTINNAGTCAGITICTWQFGPVPLGHRVVVQHIAGFVPFFTRPTSVMVRLIDQSTLGTRAQSSFFVPIAPAGTFLGSVFDQTVQAYFDANHFFQVTVVSDTPFIQDPQGEETVTLSGYELDCSVTACAPIAH